MKVELEHAGKMTFVGRTSAGQEIRMGTSIDVGGDGTAASPMASLLVAVGTCMGMDIVHILGQQKIQLDKLTASIEGEVAEDYPKRFTRISTHFILSGPDIPEAKAERAIKLSEEKYCSVSASLDRSIEKIYTFSIE